MDRFKSAYATLVAVDVARTQQKDPKRALELLAGFEDVAKGLPGEKELLTDALYARVNAYMGLGQLDKATAELVSLLDTTRIQPSIDTVMPVSRIATRLSG